MTELRADPRVLALSRVPVWTRTTMLAVAVSGIVHVAAYAGVVWYRTASTPAYVVVVPVEFMDTASLVGALPSTSEPTPDPIVEPAAETMDDPLIPTERPTEAPSPVPSPKLAAAPPTPVRAANDRPPAPVAMDEGAGENRVSAPRYVGVGLANAAPRYPFAARRRGQEGRVLLRAQIGADGGVDRVSVLSSSGVPVLDRAAREAVEGWQFEAATDRFGQPVAGAVDVPILFELTDG